MDREYIAVTNGKLYTLKIRNNNKNKYKVKETPQKKRGRKIGHKRLCLQELFNFTDEDYRHLLPLIIEYKKSHDLQLFDNIDPH